jgi:hypothetical protein
MGWYGMVMDGNEWYGYVLVKLREHVKSDG